jgi:hypothetical protein
MKHKFENGCMWEGGGFEIETNYECCENDGGEPCKHCHSIEIEENKTVYDNSIYYKKKWICPNVVIAVNEGGFNSTGVCLDCIIEAAQSLELLTTSK